MHLCCSSPVQAFTDEEARMGWTGLSSPATTAALGAVIAQLSKGNKAAEPKAKM